MRLAGFVAIYQRPNTSKPAPAHKIYPYLFGSISIERVNQVWCTDVTYIAGTGFGPPYITSVPLVLLMVCVPADAQLLLNVEPPLKVMVSAISCVHCDPVELPPE